MTAGTVTTAAWTEEMDVPGQRRHDAVGPVVVGLTSQTPDVRQTLEFAADEANRRGVGLTLVHGCSPIPMPTTLEPTTPLVEREIRWLKRLSMLAELGDELVGRARAVEIIVHPGTGVQALVEASVAASLVVVQRRRISRGRRIRSGSTSCLVALGAHAPVAVLHASMASSPSSGDVVVGVDASDPSSALSVAFAEAEHRRTGLLAVQAWSPKRASLFMDGPAEEEDLRRQFSAAHQRLVDYVRPWVKRYPDVPLRQQLFTLPPAESLLLAAAKAQLLVLGRRHSHHHLGTLMLSHVTRRCLAEASCPVLVTPGSRRILTPETVGSSRSAPTP